MLGVANIPYYSLEDREKEGGCQTPPRQLGRGENIWESPSNRATESPGQPGQFLSIYFASHMIITAAAGDLYRTTTCQDQPEAVDISFTSKLCAGNN